VTNHPAQPPSAPLTPWQAQALHQTGGTHLRLHVQGSAWTSSIAAPTITVNGHQVAAGYGDTIVPVFPGRCTVEAKARWMREYGQAAYTVDLAPGQSADVWYAAPFTQFQTGSMGPTKQPRKGGLTLGLIVAGVLLVFVVLPLVAAGLLN